MIDQEFQEHFKKLLEPFSNSGESLDGRSLRQLFDQRISELELKESNVVTLLGMERKTLIGILDRTTKRVDIINIIKLSKFLNLKTDQLLQLFVAELSPDAIGDLERANKSSFIINHFDLSNLKKGKFIHSKSDLDEIENRIVSFFGWENIFDYEKAVFNPAYSKPKKSPHTLMREFWVASAHAHFKKINNPNPYNRDALVDLLPKIKPYTRNIENGLITVIRALYNVGVTVIYQPHLPTVQVRGATFVIDGKPCIVLTDLYKKYPTIWFGLLHELCHCLYDMDDIEKYMYHLTGEPDLFLIQEDEANSFARDFLFSKEQQKYIFPFIEDEFIVQQFAEENEIHSSIIYAFYLFNMTNEHKKSMWYGKLNAHIPKSTLAVKNINVNVWDRESIEESVKLIKKTILNF
jgi:Zn-dependent peptidase ImmA (M78 family)